MSLTKSPSTSTPPSFETLCVHAAQQPDTATGAVAAPIHLSTTFERDADGGYARGWRYGREGTPNRSSLEACVAELEGGIAAFAYSSGLAANMAILEQLKPGDRIVAAREGYHGTHLQLEDIVRRRGVTVEFIDAADPSQIAGALNASTRLLWVETPANPLLTVTDLARAAELAHKVGARVVCDSTFATPYCQRPFDSGVDVVIHSGTKYFGGHSDILSGLVIVRDDRTLAAELAKWQSLAGAVLAPFDCWLLRRSIMTLGLRMQRQCANALELAGWLDGHAAIERVLYPGLASHPGHAIAVRQMHGGFGAVVSICVHGGAERAVAVAARTRLFRRATSLGGVESLIEHRASIEGPGTLTPPNLLRLSVGIEDAKDLRADLAQALA